VLKIKVILISVICLLINTPALIAQTIPIHGKVIGADDLENIHVINKTSKIFTITNSSGEFDIHVKLNDTLVFSSIQYSNLEVIIDDLVVLNKELEVNLEEYVNALDEVVVGKILTGNLMLDVGNSTAEPEINFYDVGIPGYKGKTKTQAERRLHEATTGGGIVALNPLLNAISGRTKMLKRHIALERNDELIHKIRQRLAQDFLSEHPIDESKQMDFWYFCSDDTDFMNRCKDKSDIEILAFLNEKYVQYLANIKSDE
ncbi:conserved hypothetical protein containing N-terminal carboxypeptidase-like, regulatory domain, partial [Formosa agariphila KMM 3901]